jgi:cation diffusion facilitator CzcD-associated flavoprotein CzcO
MPTGLDYPRLSMWGSTRNDEGPLKANDRAESPTRLLEQLQRVHQQTVRTADGQALHGLTEMTPAQKSLFTALQLPIPTPAELSQPAL